MYIDEFPYVNSPFCEFVHDFLSLLVVAIHNIGDNLAPTSPLCSLASPQVC